MDQNKVYLMIFIIMAILSGCSIKNEPKHVKEFVGIQTLEEVDGCYYNESDPTIPHNYRDYLSRYIWKEKIDYQGHKKIETICIRAFDNNQTIETTAMKNENILYTKTFFLGKDFNLTLGRIFKSKNEIRDKSLGIAFGHSNQIIGLDSDGNILIESNDFVAGIAVPIIPLPVIGNTLYIWRFNRKK